MIIPGVSSLVFLAYLLLILPWLAFRGARRLRAAREKTVARPQLSREVIWAVTIVNLGLLLALAFMTGREFGYRIFATRSLGIRDVVAALGAILVLRHLESPPVRGGTPQDDDLPSGAPDREGVGALDHHRRLRERGGGGRLSRRGDGDPMVLAGGPWIAAFVSATAFALAHSAQGVKSGIVILFIAARHARPRCGHRDARPAMVVHFLYDIVAGYRISREALWYDREEMPAQPA